MPKLTTTSPLAIAIGAALASGAIIAQADENPFSTTVLPSGYTLAADTTASGSSSATDDPADETDDKGDSAEGKCGEGKCGAGPDDSATPSGDADAPVEDDGSPPPPAGASTQKAN